MKTLNLKAEYLVKSDLIKMLIYYIKELQIADSTHFKVESNIGGKLEADINEEVLEDLREKITKI